jgi:hypothetical protein
MPTFGFQGASRHGTLDASWKSGASSAASRRAEAGPQPQWRAPPGLKADGCGGRERGPEGPLFHNPAPRHGCTKTPATQLVHNPSRGRRMKTAQTHDWWPTSRPVRFMAIA